MTNKEKGNVTVVMCTYNGIRNIDKQISSILTQTYPIAELIIQDDGSTDGTLELLSRYAKNNSTIHLYSNQSKHGINHNFFSALRKAKSDFIAISDQDDIWENDKIEKQMHAIGDKLLCSGRSIPFSDSGFPVSMDTRLPNYDVLRLAFIGELPGHTLLIRKQLLRYIPINAEDISYLYDWQLQLIAACHESIAYVDQTLVHFRRSQSAATATKPVSNKILSISALNYLSITIIHHKKLQDHICKRFAVIETMVKGLDLNNDSCIRLLKLAQIEQQRGFKAMLKRICFCVNNRNNLFHTHDNHPIIAFLRAIVYPYTSGYYYRMILDK